MFDYKIVDGHVVPDTTGDTHSTDAPDHHTYSCGNCGTSHDSFGDAVACCSG